MTRKRKKTVVEFDVLTAFIDGTLDPRERERVVARLDEDLESFELLSETLRNIECCRSSHRGGDEHLPAEGTSGPVLVAAAFGRAARPTFGATDESGARRWALERRRLLVLTAGLAVLVGAVAQRLGALTGSSPEDAILSAAALWAPIAPTAVRAEPVSISIHHDWPLTRGRGGPIDEAERSFRLGVLVFDLQVALAGGETRRVIELTHRVETLVEEVALSQAAIAAYGAIRQAAEQATDAPQLTELTHQAESILESIIDARRFRLGKWCEATRLAARLNVEAFFSSPAFLAGRAQWRNSEPALPDPLAGFTGSTRSGLADLETRLELFIRKSGNLNRTTE